VTSENQLTEQAELAGLIEPVWTEIRGLVVAGEMALQLPVVQQARLVEQGHQLGHQLARRLAAQLAWSAAQEPAPVDAVVVLQDEPLEVNPPIVVSAACFRRLTNQSYRQKVCRKNCHS